MNSLRWLRRTRSAMALLALVVISHASHAVSVNTRDLQIRQLAPGVYTIRHPDPTEDFPDGNTTVVVGEREVLVVDTCYLPSSADADIARIRTWTDKPVRWVVIRTGTTIMWAATSAIASRGPLRRWWRTTRRAA